MNANIKNKEIENLSLLVANEIIKGSTAQETAVYLYKAGYRKQEDVVKEFAEKLKEECHKAITHNYKAMDNRKKADEMWYICSGQNEGLNFVLKTMNELAEQYGKEEEQNEQGPKKV